MLDALPVLGDKTFDVYLNGEAFWRNILGRGLGLQARWLPDPQEVVVIPGT